MQYGSEAGPAAAEPVTPATNPAPVAARQMNAAMQPARRTMRCYIEMASQKATKPKPFGSLYTHGFARVAAAVPRVQIAEPEINTDRTLALARAASEAHAALVVFPELGLSGYSIEDLFHQHAVTGAVLDGIERIVAESAGLEPVIVVGAPLRAENGLFNTAVVVHRGSVLGVVPKTYLPEYREFYEKRHFRSARDLCRRRAPAPR